MKPYASAPLIGENQVNIEQAASCFCYQKRENRRGIREKKTSWGHLFCMTRPISILNSTALSLMNLSAAHSLMLAFLIRQLKTSFVNAISPL